MKSPRYLKQATTRFLVAAFVTMTSLCAVKAQASGPTGGDGSGGGNAIAGALLEDTFTPLVKLPGYDGFEKAFKIIQRDSPRFAARVMKVGLNLTWSLIDHELPYIGNEIGYLVDSEQVAIQKDGVVYVDLRILNRPNFKESSKSKLIMHEILLYVLKARNQTYQIGLAKDEIHKKVRNAVASLFDYSEKYHDGSFYGRIELRQLLQENDLGEWITSDDESMILSEIPVMMTSFSQEVSKLCSVGTSHIEGGDLDHIMDVLYHACASCGNREFENLQSAFRFRSTWGSANGDYQFYDFVLKNAYNLKFIDLYPDSCETAKKVLTQAPLENLNTFKDRSLFGETCDPMNLAKTRCDSETFPMHLRIDTYLGFH